MSKHKFTWSAKNKFKSLAVGSLCTMLVAGCEGSFSLPGLELPTSSSSQAESDDLAAINNAVAATAAVTQPKVKVVPTITGMGYASISSQPAKSSNQRRLMAIRAARMAAMRDLAEQIHGLQVDSNTTVVDLMVQNDTFRGVVTGTIRGARTVRINPTGADTYEIVLEIDREMMTYLLSVARQA